MVTIDNAMPYHVLVYDGATISMMSLQVFMTLQIPMSSLTLAPYLQGLGINVGESYDSIVLPIFFGVIEGFQTTLVNFHIVGLMLPYDAIITSVEYRTTQVSPPSS
jgi:hypothetical protein